MFYNLSKPQTRTPRVSAGRLVLVLLLAAAICLFALPGAALAQSGTGGGMSMPMGNMAAGAAPASSQPAAGGQGQAVVVHISNFSFGNPLTVAPGTTVQWINDDSVAHTVTADGGAFDSGSLAPGASFSFTFAQAGDFAYYCQFHGGPGGQGMASRVTVTAQGGAPAAGQNAAPQGGSNPMNNMQGGYNYAAPSPNGNKYTAPAYGNNYNKQSYGNTYRAPSYRNAYRAPSYSNMYRAPSYGNIYRAPSYGSRYAPYAAPVCPSASGSYSYRSRSASAYSRYMTNPYGSRMSMSRYGY